MRPTSCCSWPGYRSLSCAGSGPCEAARRVSSVAGRPIRSRVGSVHQLAQPPGLSRRWCALEAVVRWLVSQPLRAAKPRLFCPRRRARVYLRTIKQAQPHSSTRMSFTAPFDHANSFGRRRFRRQDPAGSMLPEEVVPRPVDQHQPAVAIPYQGE